MREVSFVSGIHRIDARLHPAEGEARGAIAVAHPHPLHGGNMDHSVIRATCDRAVAHGLTALRFDFRGVGRSEGDRTDFPGHLVDWRKALLDLRQRIPTGPLFGAGFSYGARSLAWLLHRDEGRRPEVDGVLLLAPATRVPTTRRDFGNLLLGRPISDAVVDPDVLENMRELPMPTEVLVGDRDVVAPPDELAANLPDHATLQVLDGLNHFFSVKTGAGPLAEVDFTRALDAALGRLLKD